MNENIVINRVLELFRQVLLEGGVSHGWPSLQMDDFFIDAESEQLVFSLKGLYKASCSCELVVFDVFRKYLYRSNINATLKEEGGGVGVFRSTGKVDDNLYTLKHL